MLNFKVGQLYICTKSNKRWWTEGKQYAVIVIDDLPCLVDDDGKDWSEDELSHYDLKFEVYKPLKTQSSELDLNKLTLEELEEYLELATALEEAEHLMNDFIERMTK